MIKVRVMVSMSIGVIGVIGVRVIVETHRVEKCLLT